MVRDMNNNLNNKKISLDELEKNHRRRLASIRNSRTEHIMHIFDQEEKILETLKQQQEQEKGLTTSQMASIIGISRPNIYNRLVDMEKRGKIKSYKKKISEFRIVVRYWYYHCYDQNY